MEEVEKTIKKYFETNNQSSLISKLSFAVGYLSANIGVDKEEALEIILKIIMEEI